MKKLFLGAAIAMSSLTFAQTFGVKAGMNVSSVSSDATLSDKGSKIGFNAGAFVNIPVGESFSVQPEVLYTQYGDKYKQTGQTVLEGTNLLTNQTVSSARHHDYIAVPVMLQYNATPSFYLEAGPELGFMVSAKNKRKNETSGNTLAESPNYKDNLNGFNVGIGLGAGYYFTPNIGLTARYVAGLTDFNKDNNVKERNNVFQVGLAYKFGK